MVKYYIGTSGYNYPHWKNGVFYPPDLKQKNFLEYYQDYFNSVELNVTFYRLPTEKAFFSWRRRTGKDFGFVVKGSRFITHVKKLKDCRDPLKLFSGRCKHLEDKLLCVLWQLPPAFKKNLRRLQDFITELSRIKSFKNTDQSIEFRHPSWFDEDTTTLLKENNINTCSAHSPRWPSNLIVTSDFLYARFHGGEDTYKSEYSVGELRQWAEKIKRTVKQNKLKKVYAFFNNDYRGFAVKNALELKKLLVK